MINFHNANNVKLVINWTISQINANPYVGILLLLKMKIVMMETSLQMMGVMNANINAKMDVSTVQKDNV